jgi:hypothetical protein
MTSFDDPTSLTRGERLSAIAGILAAGILRLQSRAALLTSAGESEHLPDSGPACLDVSAKTVLSVHAG